MRWISHLLERQLNALRSTYIIDDYEYLIEYEIDDIVSKVEIEFEFIVNRLDNYMDSSEEGNGEIGHILSMAKLDLKVFKVK